SLLLGVPGPVDDSAAREVVGGELDPDLVADHDPDPAQLPGRVGEHLVAAAVEGDPVHAAAERLDDLACHLNRVFLVSDCASIGSWVERTNRARRRPLPMLAG